MSLFPCSSKKRKKEKPSGRPQLLSDVPMLSLECKDQTFKQRKEFFFSKVHFTVVCLVTSPINESEAGIDFFFDRNLTAFLM